MRRRLSSSKQPDEILNAVTASREKAKQPNGSINDLESASGCSKADVCQACKIGTEPRLPI